jgi:cysteinyl-tRNA synthetase
MHNEMLLVEGKKMSKSLGNFFTVRDLLDQGVPGEVIRFVLLQTRYSKPMDWTSNMVEDAETKLRRWRERLTGVAPGKPSSGVCDALGDDINTAKAIYELNVLFLRWMNAKSFMDVEQANSAEAEFLASAHLLGLLEPGMGGWFLGSYDLSPLEDELRKLWDHAREDRDFSKVDTMKAALLNAGVEVRMSKDGVKLLSGASFDPTKLAGL